MRTRGAYRRKQESREHDKRERDRGNTERGKSEASPTKENKTGERERERERERRKEREQNLKADGTGGALDAFLPYAHDDVDRYLCLRRGGRVGRAVREIVRPMR